jgi:sterol 3beta-glucosyltransferase
VDSIDYADFHRDGPNLESKASLTDEGMINIWVNLRNQVPDLPKDYARPVQEYAVDPVGALDCPPLNVVIFIVGSRGTSNMAFAVQREEGAGTLEARARIA